VGTVTQALALERSTPTPGVRIPPQQYQVTPKIQEMDGFAMLVRQYEVRGNRVQREHAPILTEVGEGSPSRRDYLSGPRSTAFAA
jgi:predicted RNase H-like nuclease